MRDLEESILKQNVPGKYSTWNVNDDKIRADDDDNGNDNGNDIYEYGSRKDQQQEQQQEQTQTEYSTSTSTSTSTISSRQREHNTGIKGVLADHKEAKERQQMTNNIEQQQRIDSFRIATEGTRLKPGESSFSLASSIQRRQQQQQQQQNDDGSESDDDSFDDEDDEFLNSYREMRLTQLKGTNANTNTNTNHVKELTTTIQFSNTIDENTDASSNSSSSSSSSGGIYSIFHLYNDTIQSCHLLNQHLEKLATKLNQNQYKNQTQNQNQTTCYFYKIQASIMISNFDPIGYPCVLIYKNGTEVANLTPITLLFEQRQSTTTNTNTTMRVNSNPRSGLDDYFTLEDVEHALLSFCR